MLNVKVAEGLGLEVAGPKGFVEFDDRSEHIEQGFRAGNELFKARQNGQENNRPAPVVNKAVNFSNNQKIGLAKMVNHP